MNQGIAEGHAVNGVLVDQHGWSSPPPPTSAATRAS